MKLSDYNPMNPNNTERVDGCLIQLIALAVLALVAYEFFWSK